MKILVQSDDFGFTRGVVDGMVDAFENGIITSTGLFANMEIVDYAVSKIKMYPTICFGIDINVVSGPSVTDYHLLPTLCNQDTGMFVQTSERMKDPRWGKEDIFKPYDEVFLEGCNQVERFIKLVGNKPEYLQSHSRSGSDVYIKAIKDVAKKYGIPYAGDVYEKYNIVSPFEFRKFDGDPYSYSNQLQDEIKPMLEFLENNKNEEYVILPSHCGFVDAKLMEYSRCNIDRAFDHQYLTSKEIKEWIKENDAQLISFRDLPLD